MAAARASPGSGDERRAAAGAETRAAPPTGPRSPGPEPEPEPEPEPAEQTPQRPRPRPRGPAHRGRDADLRRRRRRGRLVTARASTPPPPPPPFEEPPERPLFAPEPGRRPSAAAGPGSGKPPPEAGARVLAVGAARHRSRVTTGRGVKPIPTRARTTRCPGAARSGWPPSSRRARCCWSPSSWRSTSAAARPCWAPSPRTTSRRADPAIRRDHRAGEPLTGLTADGLRPAGRAAGGERRPRAAGRRRRPGDRLADLGVQRAVRARAVSRPGSGWSLDLGEPADVSEVDSTFGRRAHRRQPLRHRRAAHRRRRPDPVATDTRRRRPARGRPRPSGGGALPRRLVDFAARRGGRVPRRGR